MANVPSEKRPNGLACLAIQAGPRIGEEILVPQAVVNIGKGNKNDVVLLDDSVSTNHARLELENGNWRITDLDSTNGTYVEGVRLAPNVPTPFPYGSSVRFGGLRMHFRPVAEADLESAEAEYVPPPPPQRLADQRRGLRIPLWVILLLLVLLVLVALFVLGVFEPDSPAAVGAAIVAPLTAPRPPPAPQ